MSSSILWKSVDADTATWGTSNIPWQATGVSIDSRTIKQGDLFIAIKGENFDGHAFVAQAFEQGAAAAMVSDIPSGIADDKPLLKVNDTFQAMQDLAVFSRKRVKGKVIGVTGSVGKTSTKEMIKVALSKQGKYYASESNLNNHYGLPLSLCRMPQSSDFGIFEMGMNHAGEIRNLTLLAQPDVAIITTVAAVHLEFFESIDGIAAAKAEIFEGLNEFGTAVINSDTPYCDFFVEKASHAGKINVFGSHPLADFKLVSYRETQGENHIVAKISGEEYPFMLGLSGRHQSINAMGVLACVEAVGADIHLACEAFQQIKPAQGRGNIVSLHHKGAAITVIDDSYNASPVSVNAALDYLGSFHEGRKIAILGDMFELGDTAADLHKGLLEKIIENTIDTVFTVGDLSENLYHVLPEKIKGGHAKVADAIYDSLSGILQSGDILLIKGSRGMKMDRLVSKLQDMSEQ